MTPESSNKSKNRWSKKIPLDVSSYIKQRSLPVVSNYATQYITQHTVYHTAHSISHSTQYITQHTVYHTTHSISHNTQYITQHIVHHTTHSISSGISSSILSGDCHMLWKVTINSAKVSQRTKIYFDNWITCICAVKQLEFRYYFPKNSV